MGGNLDGCSIELLADNAWVMAKGFYMHQYAAAESDTGAAEGVLNLIQRSGHFGLVEFDGRGNMSFGIPVTVLDQFKSFPAPEAASGGEVVPAVLAAEVVGPVAEVREQAKAAGGVGVLADSISERPDKRREFVPDGVLGSLG